MDFDFRKRSMAIIETQDGQEFQVLCYGLHPPIPPREVFHKLELRGHNTDFMVMDEIPKTIVDKFDHSNSSGRRPSRPGVIVNERPKKFFFSMRIE